MFWIVLSLIGGFAALTYGADCLVKGGSFLARALGISPLVIGLTLVAFGTSAPELLVSSAAALRGSGEIAIGNVLGSNICNTALILGLSALILPLPVERQMLRVEMPLTLLGTAAFFGVFVAFGRIDRWVGVVFFLVFLAYMTWTVVATRKNRQAVLTADAERTGESAPVRLTTKSLLINSAWVILGLILLVAGADFLVDGAVKLALRLGVSEAVISITIVALGTSLPELATSVVAACKHETEIAVGNIIGSNLFNLLAIIGVAATLSPLSAPGVTVIDFAVLLGSAAVLGVMMASGNKLSRLEGGILLAGYCGYIGYLVASH